MSQIIVAGREVSEGHAVEIEGQDFRDSPERVLHLEQALLIRCLKASKFSATGLTEVHLPAGLVAEADGAG